MGVPLGLLHIEAHQGASCHSTPCTAFHYQVRPTASEDLHSYFLVLLRVTLYHALDELVRNVDSTLELTFQSCHSVDCCDVPGIHLTSSPHALLHSKRRPATCDQMLLAVFYCRARHGERSHVAAQGGYA